MPTFDLGYRGWDGERAPKALRWLVIPLTGIPLAWRSKMVRRAVIAAWIPAFYFAVAFFAYEQIVERWVPIQKLAEIETVDDLQRAAQQEALRSVQLPEWLTWFGVPRDVLQRGDLKELREPIWKALIYQFLRAPQVVLLIVLVGMIAPPLIAHDIRTRAFLLYFSRPLTRWEYILGKGAIIAFYVALIVPAPALAIYTFAVLLSPDLTVLATTWTIPLYILGAYAILALPVTALALALSSMTTETRYAGFSWFAIWILGLISYGTLSGAPEIWQLLSLFHTFGELQGYVFGIYEPGDMPQIVASGWFVGALCIGSLLVVYRRISAPMKV